MIMSNIFFSLSAVQKWSSTDMPSIFGTGKILSEAFVRPVVNQARKMANIFGSSSSRHTTLSLPDDHSFLHAALKKSDWQQISSLLT
jgi:hypothetical protein